MPRRKLKNKLLLLRPNSKSTRENTELNLSIMKIKSRFLKPLEIPLSLQLSPSSKL
uniref:Uncharacterized protein n=1 Tax=Arundo donax TaxID=35708 RepID=A0A0A8Y6E7_ARUDO